MAYGSVFKFRTRPPIIVILLQKGQVVFQVLCVILELSFKMYLVYQFSKSAQRFQVPYQYFKSCFKFRFLYYKYGLKTWHICNFQVPHSSTIIVTLLQKCQVMFQVLRVVLYIPFKMYLVYQFSKSTPNFQVPCLYFKSCIKFRF